MDLSILTIQKGDKTGIKVFKLIIYCAILISGSLKAFQPINEKSQAKVTEIRGAVFTVDTRPLQGAIVEILGTDLSTRTDNFGMYVINRVDEFSNKQHSIKLQVSLAGYAPFTRCIDVHKPCAYVDAILKNN